MKSPTTLLAFAVRSLFVLPLILSLGLIGPKAYAEANVTGQWVALLYDQNGMLDHDEKWTLFQHGVFEGVTAITGSGSDGTTTWTSVSTVENFEFNQVNTYNISTYIKVYQGTVNADSSEITGTWIDNTAAQGTFVAQRVTPVEFSPRTQITDAPNVTIAGKTITVTMEKFSKALPKNVRRTAQFETALRAATLRAKAAKISLSYEVTVKGATKQQTRKTIISKRNQVTVKNLVPGNYVTTYRVKAIQNEKTIYSSRTSPKATFIVQGGN